MNFKKTFLFLLAALLCSLTSMADTAEPEGIPHSFTRTGVTAGTWQSFCLPMDIYETELNTWFDKVYIPDADGLACEETATTPDGGNGTGGTSTEAYEEETGLWDGEEEYIPRNSFAYLPENSTVYQLFMADYSNQDCLLIPQGFPFFAHLKADAQLTNGTLTLNGYAEETTEEGAEPASFEPSYLIYKDAGLEEEDLYDEEDDVQIIALGKMADDNVIYEGMVYFAIDEENGLFYPVDVDDMEINHAYLAATNATEILTSATPIDELNSIESLNELHLTDANNTLVAGSYYPGNLSYTRTVNNYYAGFYLPFDVDLRKMTDNIQAVYTPAGFATYNTESKITTVFLKDIDMTEILPAYTTILAKMTTDENGLKKSQNVTFTSTTKATIIDIANKPFAPIQVFDYGESGGLATTSKKYQIAYGGTLVYTEYTNTDSNVKLIFNGANGSFGSTSKPNICRAIVERITLSGEASSINNIISVFIEDSEATDIEFVKLPDSCISNGNGINDNIVYAIDGRKIGSIDCLNSLPQGIYIINGKKILK